MKTAIRFGIVGFLAGVAMALALTQICSQRVISPHELHVLWPTASLGLDFTGWSDGNAWDFMRLLLIFFGNGAVYALVASCLGALVEFLQSVKI